MNERRRPAAATLFRAFADPMRLRIINVLRLGELCVCDIVAILRVPQPTVSRQLAYLRRAGLVTARADGAWKHYALVTPDHALHRALIGCLDHCDAAVAPWAEDRVRELAVRSQGGCCTTPVRITPCPAARPVLPLAERVVRS